MPTIHVSNDVRCRAERHQERIHKNKVLYTFNSICCGEMCPLVIIFDFAEEEALWLAD